VARAQKEAEARSEDDALFASADLLDGPLPAGEVLLQQCSGAELGFLLDQVRLTPHVSCILQQCSWWTSHGASCMQRCSCCSAHNARICGAARRAMQAGACLC
jgi:hypothetical protein